MTLVNNTPYLLNVTQSNELVATNLPSGATLPIPMSRWQDRTGVAVAAYDGHGHYIGARDWVFYNGQEQVWRVDYITKPVP
jgi:hypothetical protein